MTHWFDPRGTIARRQYANATVTTFALGALALAIPYGLSDPTWSFRELGWVVDHPAQAALSFMHQAGAAAVGLAGLIWMTQAYVLLALSMRRCRDLRISPILAVAILPPGGFGRMAWIILALWKRAPAQRTVLA